MVTEEPSYCSVTVLTRQTRHLLCAVSPSGRLVQPTRPFSECFRSILKVTYDFK